MWWTKLSSGRAAGEMAGLYGFPTSRAGFAARKPEGLSSNSLSPGPCDEEVLRTATLCLVQASLTAVLLIPEAAPCAWPNRTVKQRYHRGNCKSASQPCPENTLPGAHRTLSCQPIGVSDGVSDRRGPSYLSVSHRVGRSGHSGHSFL